MVLLNRVSELIRKQEMLHAGDGVIVGFSGGPDSLCLLHLLFLLSKSMELTVVAVHVNHGLRGKDAEEDQHFAEEFCREKQMICHSHWVDVAALAKKERISTEDAGRRARYEIFSKEKKDLEKEFHSFGKKGEVKIAVAHNKNDQAETILMRVMRGTGIHGLSGMEFSREDGIIRPLLGTSREEIEEYCTKQKLNPRIDETNGELLYTRNRVRGELLPYMEENFNENIIETLCRLGKIAAATSDYLRCEAERFMETNKGNGGVSRKSLTVAPSALRHEVILQSFAAKELTRNISAAQLERADQLICGEAASGRMDFPGGYFLKVSYDEVEFCSPDFKAETGKRRMPTILIREISREEQEEIDWKNPGEHCRCFSKEAILASGKVPILRFRKPGDFIRPLGFFGTKKLQDYFVDKKIPREKRDEIPLVCLGSEILWVVGHQVSENYKVQETWEHLILIEFCEDS